MIIAADCRRCPHCGASLLAPPRDAVSSSDRFSNRPGWKAWIVGAVLGIVATLLPISGYFAWFLSSLCHEMGHMIMGMLTGSLAFPAIRLDGHAMASISDPLPFARIVIWLALGAVSTRAWCIKNPYRILLIIASVLYPIIAWPGREIAILYAGQFGELTFAGIFLWRAWTGGFTDSALERPLYAMLGWVMVVGNFVLSWGLITDTKARAAYWENGSFGLTNDLIRVGHDHLHVGLSTAAIPLLMGTLATPLLSWFIGRWWLVRNKK